jgi:hypothetical protein
MSSLRPIQLTSNSPVDPRWELARRVADSPQFRTSPKLRAFLLYVCENALLGQPENVREQLIGSGVFGRHPDYNLSEDNIVRVEAREVRKRLEAYFSGPGRDEPTTIEIPKGGYLPVFKLREQSPAEGSDREASTPQLRVEPQQHGMRWLIPAMAVCLLISLGCIVWLLTQNQRLRPIPPHPTASGSTSAEDYSFYRELLGTMGTTGRETLLLLSNPRVVLYLGTASTRPSDEYLQHTIPAPPEMKSALAEALNNSDRDLPFQFLHATRDEYTGMGEAIAAYHLGRLMQFLQRPVRLSQGRFLNWDQVQKQDLIVLGAPQINDWTNQNIGRSNFDLGKGVINNLSPLPGEQKEYRVHVEPSNKPGSGTTAYGVIKMLSAPSAPHILVLAGLTSAATAGVGEFFTAPEKMRPVYESIRAATPDKRVPSNWEVLVKVNVRDDLPVETSVVAVRPAAAQKSPAR